METYKTHQDEEYYMNMKRLAKRHFWFSVRNKILRYIISKFSPQKDNVFMEIGCGDGTVLNMINKNFSFNLLGTEINESGVSVARIQCPDIEIQEMSAYDIPYSDHFDAIGAFDVLEHLKDHELAAKEVYKALKPGGYFFITVPQHKFLWSYKDEISLHFRRYQKSEMIELLNKAGFKVKRSISFMSILVPILYLSRVIMPTPKEEEDIIYNELKINPVANFILKQIVLLDYLLIRLGGTFPFGGSLLVVAQK